MNEVMFNNENLNLRVRTVLNDDGSISINAEDTAIGFGWTRLKDNKTYIMWDRVNGFLEDFNFPHKCGKNDYIPESLFYMLGMKANNKVALEFQKWLAIDVLPAIRKTGAYTVKNINNNDKQKNIEAKLLNAKARIASQFLKLANIDTLSTEYKNILVSKAAEVLTGEKLIPLPKSKQKTYSATDIGKMFGISANKIGQLANKYNLKTEEYGEYYRDKSQYSQKEVDAFRYYDTAIPEFEKLLNSKPPLSLV